MAGLTSLTPEFPEGHFRELDRYAFHPHGYQGNSIMTDSQYRPRVASWLPQPVDETTEFETCPDLRADGNRALNSAFYEQPQLTTRPCSRTTPERWIGTEPPPAIQ